MKEKQKIFRDAVHGYISITNSYVSDLIDTFEMQRLKDVAQTGIRPIYSGATHDRFSHSIGVYHIGTKIFSSLKNNLEKTCDDEGIIIPEKTRNNMDKYEQLYYAACILHDIGHPAFSHTFEYLYNNKYINIDFKIPSCNFNEEFERIRKIINDGTSSDNTLEEALLKCFGDADRIKAQPHEMMSAYQILNSDEIKNRIRKCLSEYDVQEEDFCFIARMIIGLKYNHEEATDSNQKLDWSIRNCIIGLLNGIIDADSIDYLNRNSQVAGYDTYHLDIERICNAFSAYYDPVHKIFRPCFSKTALSALEGFVSARNYEPKWLYNHHKIIYYDEYLVKYLYKKCNRYLFAILSHCNSTGTWINKLCDRMLEDLKVIDELDVPGSLDYRHYSDMYGTNLNSLSREISNTILNGITQREIPKEILQSIQNISYIDLNKSPIKELCKCDTQLKTSLAQWNIYAESYNDKKIGLINSCQEICGIASYALENISNKFLIQEDINKTVHNIKECFAITKKYLDIYSAMREAFLVNGIAPIVQFDTTFFDMYKTSDSDISSIFKIMYLKYKNLTYGELSSHEKRVGTEEEFIQFKKALAEFNTRQYRQSFWKSEYEYNLLIERVEKRTSLSASTIHQELVHLIEKGTPEEFEDPQAFQSNKKNQVYGNTGNPFKAFSNVFGIFGKGLVIKVYHIKYKNFGKLKIKFSDSIKDYADLGFVSKKDADFPYLYYVEKGDGTLDDDPYKDLYAEYSREDLMTEFEQRFVDYLLNKHKGTGDGKMTTNYIRNGKTIRDPIYGDIFVPQRFVELIDTKVFQRLRRIKQLAAADYVFPEATHTRFSHSLGVFHIMNMMLEHFCDLFDWLNISYSQADKDAILVAALLHDIGHGPYSHAFEKALDKSHESWTEELILKDEELNTVIMKNFGKEFPKHVISYLKYSKDTNLSLNEFSLEMVFSTLINSQLDADRLDYLLRDAYNTGVKLGSIDLQKIISYMELTKYNGNICVCINEDALVNIEQLILGRYNMYDKVYNASYKIYAEELIDKIIKRIFSNDKALAKSDLLCKLYESKHSGDFNHKDYMELDDYKLYEEIHNCLSCDDPILSKMVSSFYNRTGYNRIRVLDETTSSIEEFFKKLKLTFNLDSNCNGIIRATKSYYAYDASENQHVLISKRNGTVSDITRESKIFCLSTDNILWLTTTGCVYINYDILKDERPDLDIETLKSFIASYDIRRHMEIEEKYCCTRGALQDAKHYLDSVAEVILNDRKYKIENSSSKEQLDEYYDSCDKLLARNGYSLRCRSKGDSFVFTIKHSANENNGKNNGQFIRTEFEHFSTTSDILGCEVKSFLENNLGKFLQEQNCSIEELFQKSLNVKNNRSSYSLKRENSDFCCEISLDDVTYEYNGQSAKDYQVEIELKSEHHIHKIELKNLAEGLITELKIQNLGDESESKYLKGLCKLGLL